MLGLFNFMSARFGVNAFLWATPLLALAVGAGAGAWGGYMLGRAPVLVELADLRTTQAETAKLQALASARELSKAQQRGDALTTRLVTRQAEIDQLRKSRHDAIAAFTSGRHCLSADAVRVLNDTAAAPGGSVDVPTPSGRADAAGGTFATDADVGHWAADARAQHEQCREQLDALIDWHQPMGHQRENRFEN